MAKGRSKPVMTVIFWGGIAVLIMAYGGWCVYDGWFNEGYEDAQANKLMAVVAFAIAGWVLWQGSKEYRKEAARLKAQDQASGVKSEDGDAQKPSDQG